MIVKSDKKGHVVVLTSSSIVDTLPSLLVVPSIDVSSSFIGAHPHLATTRARKYTTMKCPAIFCPVSQFLPINYIYIYIYIYIQQNIGFLSIVALITDLYAFIAVHCCVPTMLSLVLQGYFFLSLLILDNFIQVCIKDALCYFQCSLL